MKVIECVVDNRVCLLGLDEMYRERMKNHEQSELLLHARDLASALNVAPAEVPIEGYYTETPELAEYFQLMRGLQQVEEKRASEVAARLSYQRLKQVTESALYGRMDAGSDKLFKGGVDPLTRAMNDMAPEQWGIDSLTNATHDIAVAEDDDCSLVACAALAKDPVVLTALRESVVLYALEYLMGMDPEYQYVWKVDPLIEQRINAFVRLFNELFGENIPHACESNASLFHDAYGDTEILGRCVRIATNPFATPEEHYHWAIVHTDDGFEVEEFWDRQLWTTEMWRKKQGLWYD